MTKAVQTGNIGVTSENIFPIIKKFLYSDHEIFLRELVANAVDATQKLKALAASGELTEDMGNIQIEVSTEPEKGIIRILDRGIGMTEDEVQQYINQIAFSSAGSFLEKYKDQINNIIGHFGLGFYSAFMVSSKVEIITKSYQKDAPAVKWSCHGDPEYTLEPAEKAERGTEIILYLDEESKDFAQKEKVQGLLQKYCRFLPVEIMFDDKLVNDPNPLWTRKPGELKEEDYMNFYRQLYPMQEDPLFYIHLNVDYPFNLTGILYFPKLKDRLDASRNKIQLYCNQVFVTDSVENIVPDFLTLLHGVIDSPDIPLNVSRSYLQSDANVKKISSHISKKVADRLEELFKNERAQLESKWDNLKLFIEYGMLSDEKFFERAEKFYLFKNTEQAYFSCEEYKTAISAEQTDKEKQLVYLYATDAVAQYAAIEAAKNRGYDVLLLDTPLTAHFVNLLESKWKDSRFTRVDGDVVDKLIAKSALEKSDWSEEEQQQMRQAFEAVLPTTEHYHVSFENLRETDQPVQITRSEFMRRYREMSALGGGMNFYGNMPESLSLVVNCKHPVVQRILAEKQEKLSASLAELTAKGDEGKEEAQRELMQDFGKSNPLIGQLCDLALLSNNLLQGEALSKFIKRSVSLI